VLGTQLHRIITIIAQQLSVGAFLRRVRPRFDHVKHERVCRMSSICAGRAAGRSGHQLQSGLEATRAREEEGTRSGQMRLI